MNILFTTMLNMVVVDHQKRIKCQHPGCKKIAELFWKTPNRMDPYCYCPAHARLIHRSTSAESLSESEITVLEIMDE
jgi:hypothetical protein